MHVQGIFTLVVLNVAVLRIVGCFTDLNFSLLVVVQWCALRGLLLLGSQLVFCSWEALDKLDSIGRERSEYVGVVGDKGC